VSEMLLMKGNEAMAEAALRAGAEGYFAYPITPQSEVAEYMAREAQKRGIIFSRHFSDAGRDFIYCRGTASLCNC